MIGKVIEFNRYIQCGSNVECSDKTSGEVLDKIRIPVRYTDTICDFYLVRTKEERVGVVNPLNIIQIL